jgi:DNA-binding transcriptional LysR family regulator
VDTSWLADLIEIDKHGSFSKAAVARNISVSALSRRIQQLEAWARHPLVERSEHPVGLTAQGRQVLLVAKAVTLELDLLRHQLGGATGNMDPIRFVMPTSASVAVFPRLLSLLQQELGALSINLIPSNFREVMHRFQSGEAEFALYYNCEMYLPRVPFEGTPSLVIVQDVLVPVACDAAAASERRRSQWRIVMLDDSSYLGQVAHAAMLRHQVDYTVTITGSQIMATRQFALEGMGVAWQPASLVADDLKAKRLVRVLPKIPPIPIQLRVVRQPSQLNAGHEAVWQELQKWSHSGGFLNFSNSFA